MSKTQEVQKEMVEAMKAKDAQRKDCLLYTSIAKKSEAREKDLAGAIDYVLTFQEVRDIFEATKIDPEQMQESDKDHSSREIGRAHV